MMYQKNDTTNTSFVMPSICEEECEKKWSDAHDAMTIQRRGSEEKIFQLLDRKASSLHLTRLRK
jgi:hypothetical protein